MLQRACDSGQFVDAFLHAGDGGDDLPAVATGTAGGWQELTYGELARRVDRVAAGLAARGVRPGERVVLVADAGPSWVATLLGILRCGAVAVPLDPGLTEDEMAPMVARSSPAAVLGPEELDGIGDSRPAAPAGPVGAPRRLDDAAMVVWTSGTTGAPKGVTLSFGNVAYSVEKAVASQRPGAGDRWLSVLPVHHLLELCCGVLPALASGGFVTFARTLMPHELAGIIRECRVTRMVAVPLLLRLLEKSVAGSGLETVYCGGAPLDPALVDRYASTGIAVYPGYGLTEAAPTVAMNTPEHHRAGSVGRPLPGTEVRIAGVAGHDDGAGVGEILVRSPAVMQGYWGDGVLTAGAVDGGGWLHTGDIGFVDADGFLFVTGRAKRMVVLESGKKVQPEEVEAAIAASDLFAEVCVVGVTGAGGGAAAPEQVCAVVVPTAAMAARHPERGELHEAAAAEVALRTSSLSGYKRPALVKVHAGALPRTLKGAPRHTEVARMVEEGRL